MIAPMNAKVFIDSNILVYAYDCNAGRKQKTAQTILLGLWGKHAGSLSMQVLQEFYVTVTRKLKTPLSRSVARAVVDRYSFWSVATTPNEIRQAFQNEDRAGMSFWDALIVAAAVKAGAKRILTEDMNHGQTIAGIIIENPFLAH